MSPEPTPSQTIGPFFHDALLHRDLTKLIPPDEPGAVRISGVVYDGAGETVTDAMVEISQARPAGDDRSGWGRSGTAEGGRFSFVVPKPAPAPAPDGTPQAPHINVLVFARGLLKPVATRLYFPDEEEGNAADPVLSSIEDPALRRTLVARDEGGGLRFDIRLQGEGQTVFFGFEG